jgi:hypothetical protein
MIDMNFIKKVHDKNFDESVHLQFQKFSKGEFKNRAIVYAKFSGGKYTLNTSAEFANELVRDMAEKLGSNKTKITGGIISTVNLKEIPEYHDLLAQAIVKQFQGVKNFQIDLELNGKEIIKMIDAFPKAFFALSFSVGEDVLKIKPKAPKSGKPGTKGEDAPKPDFCKLITKDKKLAETFIFENSEFKTAEIIHDFFIDKIEIPNELKTSEDFALVREKSKRIGRILRKATIDGNKVEKELELRA